ncbi:DUF1488 family protein [uncultured Sphingomonas sp.]|uniref:DUF1488 family protein n=1 Tax=uncultured Sphingomonas sp. TaxID=158754 RepID=UPI0025DFF9D7|nr:DUF1488 family protein [uncultured Sphingomonas sp.]
MPNTGLTIDTATFTDNPTDYQVEFAGTVDGEQQQFAVKYSALEALAGEQTLDDPLSVAQAQAARLTEAAGKALDRGQASELVTIGEGDLL